jgi:Zn-dependent metalloprotease
MDTSIPAFRCGCCYIVPPAVLRAISQGHLVKPKSRKIFQDSFLETQRLRSIREGFRVATVTTKRSFALAPTPVHQAIERLFDCKHRESLPGEPVNDLDHDPFLTVRKTTAKVAEFYQTVLGRNSIDGRGMDLISSLNYGVDYQNAFWNGQQMVYGNGDQHVFVDFWRSPDVIGHELSHGVTQNESGLRYEGESGALNESISDCFGAVFNQWLNNWPSSNEAGWLVGAGIIGPDSRAKGLTCLRDMVDPTRKHCLSPQPDSYDDFDTTADVHENSGIPNKAFALFARAVGGNAWDAPIKVWYDACTGRHLSSSATLSDFAIATIAAADRWQGADKARIKEAVAQAWAGVKVPTALA